MDFQSRWWIENRRRRWLEHVDNVRERTNDDEEDEESDGEDKCGDLYWLYAMLAMLLELESSIEESAFQPSGERERRRWRRECEYLEEAVRESIGLEAAPHRILMGREREQVRTAAFGRGERDEEDGPNNNSSSSGIEDEDEDEDEEEGERIISRRLRRQRHSIARNTNNNNSASDLHPVSFRVERRESVPLRVVETDEAEEAEEAEEMFSNYSTANADAQTVGRRSSVIQFSRDSPRTRMRHVLENNNNNNNNNNNDATPNVFARPTDILETVYSSFDADINARSLREAHMRIARAAREGLDASTHLATIISHLTTQRATTTTSARSTSTNTPPSMVNRGYRSSSISRRRLDFDEDEDENDEQEHSENLKNEITRLKDQIDKLEKASTCVICYSNPRACALLPCCHFTTCLECANRSRERFVEQANEDEDDEDEDAGEDENDDDINNNNTRKVKKNEVFFRCPTCRANVTGVLQVFPP